MNKLILIPQFIDRAGSVVYNVFKDDPDCRTLRAGKLLGQVRFNDEEAQFKDFELIVPLDQPELDLPDPMSSGVQHHGSG